MNPIRMICALALILTVAASLSAGQTGESERRTGILGGHQYVPNSFVPDPFVRTTANVSVGFGVTPAMEKTVVTIGGQEIVGVTGSLVYGVMDIGYQQQVREWLAVYMRALVNGRLADETTTLISQGVTLATAYELGWLFRVMHDEQRYASVGIQVSNGSLTDIYLQRFIEGIIADGEVKPENRLVQATPTLRGGVQFTYTQALSDLVGLTFSGLAEYGESPDRGAHDRWYGGVGAAADFNLLNTSGTPIGFVAGANMVSNPVSMTDETSKKTMLALFGGMYYTGARDFDIGIDLGYMLSPVRDLPKREGYIVALVGIKLRF